MNTTFSIRLDNELKTTFLSKTKEKWLDWASIIRHFMEKFTSNPDIVKLDIDDNIFDDLFQNPEIISKLTKISTKMDKLWF